MALGRKNVSVARANSGPDIFRLAGLLGDDNLIRHEVLVWRIGSGAIRTYSEPASLASYLSMKGFGRAGPVSRPHSRADQPENPAVFFRSAEGTGETDSPTEQRGFEPLVPRKNGWTVLTTLIDPKALLLRENQANSRERDGGFESVFLQRRVTCEPEFPANRDWELISCAEWQVRFVKRPRAETRRYDQSAANRCSSAQTPRRKPS